MSSEIGERIVVLGSSGSGKTVLARELAEDWAEVPDEVFIERIAAFTEGDAWVVGGNGRPPSRPLARAGVDARL